MGESKENIFILNTRIQQSDFKSYSNPIPSREFIMNTVAKGKNTLNREQIASALGLDNAEQKEALRRRLRAMERDGQLMLNKHKGYHLIDQDLLVTGTVSIHQDGFAFVSYSATEKDLFLPAGQVAHVFDGDVVQVLIPPNLKAPSSSGRRSPNKLIKVLERKTTHIVGELKRKGNRFFLIPESSKVSQKIDVDNLELLDAKAGQYVNAEIIEYPSYRHTTLVKITEVLGHPQDPGMEIKVALRRHGIASDWDDDLLDHADKLGTKVAEKDKAIREDYRDLPFVTIDGADAKDFDDAVYCEKDESGDWRLLVAIADVSHYVRPDDLLDQEAQSRATSIYFPGHVVPMIPKALSNGLCSLNPNVDRLAIVCEMTINSQGLMTSAEFCEAVIHSHARLTYDQAYAVAINKVSGVKRNSKLVKQVIETTPDVVPYIEDLYTLYNVLKPARTKRDAIDFDTQELKFNLTKKQKIASMSPVIRNDAHKMIEEFMLCANVATADFLQTHKIPALYRSHEGPTQKKLTLLRTFLAEKGLSLGGGEKPTSRHYNHLLNSIDQRGDASIIRTMLLRSQSQAQYSPKNDGHFGLAYDAYAHFTSPIRRYPDLLAHRAIRAKINSQKSTLQRVLNRFTKGKGLASKGYPYDSKAMEELGMHCSNQSRQADEVSREVENWLKCQYMQKFKGESFSATVSGVTNFGLFVELDQMGIEGLVHISNLNNSTEGYALGDGIDVVLNKVDLQQRKIDFLIQSDDQQEAIQLSN
jgi:ribonuclease R